MELLDIGMIIEMSHEKHLDYPDENEETEVNQSFYDNF